jgi:hypothetical protein
MQAVKRRDSIRISSGSERPASHKRKTTHQPPNLLPAPTLPSHLRVPPTSCPCVQQYSFSLLRPLPRLLRKPRLIPTRLRPCPRDRPLRTGYVCLAVRRSGDADGLADVGTDGEDCDVGRNGAKGEIDEEGTGDDQSLPEGGVEFDRKSQPENKQGRKGKSRDERWPSLRNRTSRRRENGSGRR